MQTISIIGCGWLGLALGKFLVKKGFTVKGSTTSKEKIESIDNAGVLPFHIQVIKNRIEGEKISEFFGSDILIINIPPGRKNPNVEIEHPLQIEVIVQQSKASKIIFVGSTGVYGEENPVTIETDRLNPSRASTKALVAVENYLKKLSHKEITILRLAGLVGGDRQAGRFFAGKKEVSDPEKPVNMVHREDVIKIIYQIIVQSKWNEIYNVCADEHPSKKEFYTSQAKKMGLEVPQFIENTSKPNYKIVSNQKIKKDLNYQFSHPDPMLF